MTKNCVKQFILLFIAIIAIVCFLFELSACGTSENSEHIHTYNADNVCTVCGYKLDYTEGLTYYEYGEGYVFCGGGANQNDITVAAYYNGLPVKYIMLYGAEAFAEWIMASAQGTTISDDEFGLILETYYGDSITTMTVPDGITDVTLSGYTAIKNVTLSDTVSSLTVYDCENLEEINITSYVTWLRFDECPKLTTETENGITYYKNCVISCDENLIKAEIREGTTIINWGMGVFSSNTNLKEVIIPGSMINISGGAFSYCSSLESVTITEGVKVIDQEAFWHCDLLSEIIIPDSVTTIGIGAFGHCVSLINIIVPDSVTTIEDGAFYNCSSLTSIYYHGTADDWSNIAIGAANDNLTSEVVYYYAEDGTIMDAGNYWYYDNDGNIKTWSI